MNTQQSMMYDLMLYDFAVTEASLFLDTHPQDKEALNYFKEACSRRDKAKTAYEKQFGAINNRSVAGNIQSYIQTPWPWEGEKVCGSMRNDYNFQ